MKRVLLATGILLLSVPAMARAQGADYALDGRASSVAFRGKSTLHDFQGKAGTVSGRLNFSQDGPMVTGEVAVPVLSLVTGNKAMDRNMYAMFEAAEFPGIVLKIEPLDRSSIREGADSPVVVRGVLAIHGVSRQALIPAQARLEQGRYVLEGNFSVSLKEYRLKAPKMLFIKVADQVQVDFSVVFVPP